MRKSRARPLLVSLGALLLLWPFILVPAAVYFQTPLPGVDYAETDIRSTESGPRIETVATIEVSDNLVANLLSWLCGTILLASLVFRGSENSRLLMVTTCALIAVSCVRPVPLAFTAALLSAGILVRQRRFFGSKAS